MNFVWCRIGLKEPRVNCLAQISQKTTTLGFFSQLYLKLEGKRSITSHYHDSYDVSIMRKTGMFENLQQKYFLFCICFGCENYCLFYETLI